MTFKCEICKKRKDDGKFSTKGPKKKFCEDCLRVKYNEMKRLKAQQKAKAR